MESFSTLSSSSGSGNTLKSPSFWLQPKAIISSHSSDYILQQPPLQHVQVNNPPPSLIGKLVPTSTAVVSINNHQQPLNQQQNVSTISNPYMEEENAGNNYSDIFSRAMEQANIPEDILTPPAADNSPLQPQTLLQPPVDYEEQTKITTKQLISDMIAVSSDAGGVCSVALSSTVAGVRSVTLQSRHCVGVDSTALSGGITTPTSNFVPNTFGSTESNIPLSFGNRTITSRNNSGNSGNGISLQSPVTTRIALTSGSSTNISSGTVLPNLVEALDSIPDMILQPSVDGANIETSST